MKQRIFYFTLVVLILATGSVHADIGVWTFDELPTPIYGGSFIPDGYAGFTWENMGYVDPTEGFYSNSGYNAGMVSPPHVALNGNGITAAVSGGIFSFGGAYLTGAWNDGLNIQVDGYFEGDLKYTQIVVVNSTAPTWFDFNYYGIDRLEFSSWGGTLNPDYGTVPPPSSHFAMDNFTIVPVPIPGAFLLGSIGLALAGWKLRKSREL